MESKHKYTPKKLTLALNDIRTGRLKVLEACRLYNIPRATLYFKLSGTRSNEFCRPGPQAFLGEDIEKKIETWLLENFRNGFSATKDSLQYSVKSILEQFPQDVRERLPFKNNMPGRKWFASFKSRHPRIVEKLAEHKNESKVTVDESRIQSWYSKTAAFMAEKRVSDVLQDPRRIFYMEEVCAYVNAKEEIVLTKKKKAIYGILQNYRENVTVMLMANAAADFLPPLAVHKGKTQQGAKSVPISWIQEYSNSGWMSSEIFHRYVVDVLYPHLKTMRVTFPVIIYVDGNFSCMSVPLSDFCAENDIIFVSTLPKMPCSARPLDGIYSVVKSVWKTEENRWSIICSRTEDKNCILFLINTILRKETYKKCIVNGFELSGLYPFNMANINFKEEFSNVESYDGEKEVSKCNCKRSLIEYLESKIPSEVVDMFRVCSANGTPWTGYVGYSALYDLWREIIRDTNENIFQTAHGKWAEDSSLVHFMIEEEIVDS